MDVTGMSTFTSSTCLQFPDNTTLYKRCKVKDIPDYANNIKNNREHLKAWSYVNVLVFNGMKTKTMIFSTRQVSRYHHLGNTDICSVVLKGNGAENRVKKKYYENSRYENKSTSYVERTCRQCYKVIIWYVTITEIIQIGIFFVSLVRSWHERI